MLTTTAWFAASMLPAIFASRFVRRLLAHRLAHSSPFLPSPPCSPPGPSPSPGSPPLCELPPLRMDDSIACFLGMLLPIRLRCMPSLHASMASFSPPSPSAPFSCMTLPLAAPCPLLHLHAPATNGLCFRLPPPATPCSRHPPPAAPFSLHPHILPAALPSPPASPHFPPLGLPSACASRYSNCSFSTFSAHQLFPHLCMSRYSNCSFSTFSADMYPHLFPPFQLLSPSPSPTLSPSPPSPLYHLLPPHPSDEEGEEKTLKARACLARGRYQEGRGGEHKNQLFHPLEHILHEPIDTNSYLDLGFQSSREEEEDRRGSKREGEEALGGKNRI